MVHLLHFQGYVHLATQCLIKLFKNPKITMSYLCMILQLREYGAFFRHNFEHLASHQISFIINHTSRV